MYVFKLWSNVLAVLAICVLFHSSYMPVLPQSFIFISVQFFLLSPFFLCHFTLFYLSILKILKNLIQALLYKFHHLLLAD